MQPENILWRYLGPLGGAAEDLMLGEDGSTFDLACDARHAAEAVALSVPNPSLPLQVLRARIAVRVMRVAFGDDGADRWLDEIAAALDALSGACHAGSIVSA
ncbi:hypothetical protein KPL78_04225 [Roseomonas sp. HJA6]|uniref:Uncharacterized protein n=1 Tax=Roseomonas alba TaxID=2846776 RepID=A0ABS7A780_9PROT|nr:hypothetical protein [Neoroseomonas alba]MBW6397039.1 hypothetical protein [Neoroseomonas alba]